MKTKNRSFLARGIIATALTLVLFAESGCGKDTSTDSYAKQPPSPTIKITTMTSTDAKATSTSATSAKTSTTTTTTTTTTATTTTTTTQTHSTTISPQTTTTCLESTIVSEEPVLPITESERIMLCNLVGREYGADWISVYDKACVVAVVMNRVNSPSFPNNIYDVLTQPHQFEGYLPNTYYTSKVTKSCIESVNYYFNHRSEFGGWLYYSGDGRRNYFR